MENYSAKQWTLIDLANHLGKDKDVYKDRLAFGREILEAVKEGTAEEYTEHADNPALFTKGIMAVEKMLRNEPTGHVIGLDACNSGPQILSALMHCEVGMRNTGLINTGTRPDGYSILKDNMYVEVDVTRKQVKNATVPYAYGSDYKPELIFGEELFHEYEKAYERTFPEAYLVRKILINAWNEDAPYHEFTLPNGLVAHLECRAVEEYRAEIEGYTYTYATSINRPLKKGEKGSKSLVANVTHGADGMVVQELDERCNYNQNQLRRVIEAIDNHLEQGSELQHEEFLRIQELALVHNFVSVANWNNIIEGYLAGADETYLLKLRAKAIDALMYQSFETFSIHDEFKCGVNNVERMRYVYNSIMAELYQSTWLLDVIEQLTGDRYDWDEPTKPEIVKAIMESDYAIS
ncbi:DNA-directed RNA polymerase [Vibrio phage vB_VhaP_PG11]|nr:DNA-directed RNA polymerase [Vibrio phage vB_VhaP_PG11]